MFNSRLNFTELLYGTPSSELNNMEAVKAGSLIGVKFEVL